MKIEMDRLAQFAAAELGHRNVEPQFDTPR
jgi:hypothetical protein